MCKKCGNCGHLFLCLLFCCVLWRKQNYLTSRMSNFSVFFIDFMTRISLRFSFVLIIFFLNPSIQCFSRVNKFQVFLDQNIIFSWQKIMFFWISERFTLTGLRVSGIFCSLLTLHFETVSKKPKMIKIF